MAQLKSIFESLGLNDVETFIASGNVIFTTKSTSVSGVVKKIESALRAELGYDVPVFIRTDAELARIVARKHAVFDESAVQSAHSLNVGVMHAPLSADAVAALQSFNSDCESFGTDGSEVFMLLHAPVTNSKFSITKFEKVIGASTTFRNMNTMERLAMKYPARES